MHEPTASPSASPSASIGVSLAAILGATLSATTCFAQVVVVDVPQYPGSVRYDLGALSPDGNYAVFRTDQVTPRVVRWNATTNALLALEHVPGNYPLDVTIAGAALGASSASNEGVRWGSDGSVLPSPLPGPIGSTIAASANGGVTYLTDASQSSVHWIGFPGTSPLGRPSGTTAVRVHDVNSISNIYHVGVVSALAAGKWRAYRVGIPEATYALDFDPIPLLDGMTENVPAALDHDFVDHTTRVVGWASNDASAQGFLHDQSTGLIPMGLPANAVAGPMRATGDCTLACGRYSIGSTQYPFVWSLYEGLMTAREFVISRGYNPGTLDFEVLDFNSSGSTALVRVGSQTKLLKALFEPQCGVGGGCFTQSSSPGCGDATCCEAVCDSDPYCCSTRWDGQCVIEAESICRTGASCLDPKRITPFVGTSYAYDTGDHNPSPASESSCGKGDDRAVWRVYRSECNEVVTIDTCAASAEGPITLSVYSTCGDEIACNQGAYLPCGSTRANVWFPATGGTDYLIRIASSGGTAAGSIVIDCAQSCGSPTAGSCVAIHANPGCSDASCCGIVCANDPYCCDTTWDAQCVGEATNWCDFPAGDLDFDGDVDAADLSQILANWGSAGPTDLDGDGTTGASDLSMLLDNWG